MRQVDRKSVPPPTSLLTAEREREPNYAEDVVRYLRYLYLDKCYLCEKRIGEDGLVDQFHPVHSRHPGRALEWANLHWSCWRCRVRKLADSYQLLDAEDPLAPATLLIDPSGPPYDRRVDELIRFDRSLRAEAIGEHIVKVEVANTVDFLNGPPWSARRSRFESLVYRFSLRHWAKRWRRLLLQKDLSPFRYKGRDKWLMWHALKLAHRLYAYYLQEHSPFFVSISQALKDMTGLSVQDFKELSEAYQEKWKTLRGTDMVGALWSSGSPGCTTSGGDVVFNINAPITHSQLDVDTGGFAMGHNVRVGGSAIITIDAIVTQSRQIIQNASSLDYQQKGQFEMLVVDFERELNKLNAAHAAEAGLLANRLKEVAEVLGRPKRDRSLLEMSAEGLKSAARAVKEIVPDLLVVAEKIASFVVGFG